VRQIKLVQLAFSAHYNIVIFAYLLTQFVATDLARTEESMPTASETAINNSEHIVINPIHCQLS